MNPHRIPSGFGVIAWQGQIVVWEIVDEWAPQTLPYGETGTMTQQVRTGGKVPEARVLGSQTLLEITPELRAAIEADRAKVKS